MPTSEQAQTLLSQYAREPSDALRAQIVEAFLPLAGHVARRFAGRGADYDDLYQVASLALLKAVERYDPDKGVKFVTFVTPTMVGEVRNYFRDHARTLRLPRRGMEIAARLARARAGLEQRLGRSPTLDELTAETGVDEAEALEALELSAAAAPVSLDAQIGADEDDAPLSQFLGFDEAGFADFERRDQLSRAMEALDERQREVLRQRYFENRTQRDVAARMNLSQMTVSRVERAALEALKEKLSPQEGNRGEKL